MPVTWNTRRPTVTAVYTRSGAQLTVLRTGVSDARIDVFEVVPAAREDTAGRVVRTRDVSPASPKEPQP